MNEERLYSLIAAFEKYVGMLVKINDSLPPAHDIEARAKAFDQIYVLSVSMMGKIRHDLLLIKDKEIALNTLAVEKLEI